MFNGRTLIIIIKAASSDERALAVHARKGMPLFGCAAYPALSPNYVVIVSDSAGKGYM